MKCTLHIGTAKTGSTSIQKFLAPNRQILAKEYKILYPRFETEFFTGPTHRALAYYATGESRLKDRRWNIKDRSEKLEWEERFAESFEVLVQSKREFRHFLFSSEHLHADLSNRKHVDRLYGLLSPYFDEFRVVVFLKPQSSLAVSRYSTLLRSGKNVEGPIPRGKAARSYYDYSHILGWWTKVFGQPSIQIKILDDRAEEPVEVVKEMCSVLGISADSLKPLPGRRNEALGAASLDFLEVLNRYCAEEGLKLSKQLRHAIVKSLNSLEVKDRRLPSRKAAREFDARYDEGNRRLAEIFNLSEPLFQVDYSRYPEQTMPSSSRKSYEVLRHVKSDLMAQGFASPGDRDDWYRIEAFLV